jgi:hypothetical protein
VSRDFSWSAAALAGFGVLRREPRAVLTWSLVGLVLTLAQQVIAVNAEIFRKANSASFAAPMMGLLGGLISLVAAAIFSAAVYRAVLPDRREGRGLTRFGPEEIRLALVWLVQGLLILVPFILSAVPVTVVGNLKSRPSDLVMGSAAVSLFAIALIVSLLLMVRLSVSGPMAIAEGRWSVGASWRLTRGRTWKMVGVYLPVILVVATVYWLWRATYAVVAAALGGEFSVSLVTAGTSVAALFQLPTLIFTILTAGLSAAGAAVLHAPAAVIYRDLKGFTPDDQAAVFD